MKIIIAMLIKGPKAMESLKFFFFNKIKIIEKIAAITKASLNIITTRQTGGLITGYKPEWYQPASQGAGFHFVQTLLFLPL